MIDALARGGMDCARLNFSHGDHETHAKVAAMVRQASKHVGRPIALLADLGGPKIRIRRFEKGPVKLEAGQSFVLSTEERKGDEHGVSVTYDRLPLDTKPGDAILLDDGLLRLRVRRV